MQQLWQDASGAVKAVVVIGGLLIAYLGVGFFAGLPPWASGCECEGGAACVDGECVQAERGFAPPS